MVTKTLICLGILEKSLETRLREIGEGQTDAEGRRLLERRPDVAEGQSGQIQ